MIELCKKIKITNVKLVKIHVWQFKQKTMSPPGLQRVMIQIQKCKCLPMAPLHMHLMLFQHPDRNRDWTRDLSTGFSSLVEVLMKKQDTMKYSSQKEIWSFYRWCIDTSNTHVYITLENILLGATKTVKGLLAINTKVTTSKLKRYWGRDMETEWL